MKLSRRVPHTQARNERDQLERECVERGRTAELEVFVTQVCLLFLHLCCRIGIDKLEFVEDP